MPLRTAPEVWGEKHFAELRGIQREPSVRDAGWQLCWEPSDRSVGQEKHFHFHSRQKKYTLIPEAPSVHSCTRWDWLKGWFWKRLITSQTINNLTRQIQSGSSISPTPNWRGGGATEDPARRCYDKLWRTASAKEISNMNRHWRLFSGDDTALLPSQLASPRVWLNSAVHGSEDEQSALSWLDKYDWCKTNSFSHQTDSLMDSDLELICWLNYNLFYSCSIICFSTFFRAHACKKQGNHSSSHLSPSIKTLPPPTAFPLSSSVLHISYSHCLKSPLPLKPPIKRKARASASSSPRRPSPQTISSSLITQSDKTQTGRGWSGASAITQQWDPSSCLGLLSTGDVLMSRPCYLRSSHLEACTRTDRISGSTRPGGGFHLSPSTGRSRKRRRRAERQSQDSECLAPLFTYENSSL